ncbi:hypothetical protein D3218_10910 [Aureimonas flava]|uniref:Outer membrane lipoprotein omp10 n=1 Tax=Aureimonas flava TaxID=2320271 RepID=A0A3A1WT44_9HYPH|nr:hypothetical protein [Aureimonas flava]RIY00905.1 hypothetical protein D3218_10910 [Aureimonas flava]
MRSLSTVLPLAAALLALSACQSMAPPPQMAAAPRATGLEGEWSSVGGPVAYTATFAGGRFTSREAATGAVLAEGNYTKMGASQASIIYRSRSRNQQMSVNCNQMAADRLACVDANGSRFEFSRRA